MSKTLNSPQDIGNPVNHVCDVKMVKALLKDQQMYDGPVDGSTDGKEYFEKILAYHKKYGISEHWIGERLQITKNSEFYKILLAKASRQYKNIKPVPSLEEVIFCSDSEWYIDVEALGDPSFIPKNARAKLYEIINDTWSEVALPFRNYEGISDIRGDGRVGFQLHLPEIYWLSSTGQAGKVIPESVAQYINKKLEDEHYEVDSIKGNIFTFKGPFWGEVISIYEDDKCAKAMLQITQTISSQIRIAGEIFQAQQAMVWASVKVKKQGEVLDKIKEENIKRWKEYIPSFAGDVVEELAGKKSKLSKKLPSKLSKIQVLGGRPSAGLKSNIWIAVLEELYGLGKFGWNIFIWNKEFKKSEGPFQKAWEAESALWALYKEETGNLIEQIAILSDLQKQYEGDAKHEPHNFSDQFYNHYARKLEDTFNGN